MLTEVCVQDINYTSSFPTTAGKMKMNLITAVFVVVACLVVQAAESKEDSTIIFSEPAERVARSIQPRQINLLGSSNCTQDQLDNIFDGYPSDCPSVNRSNGIVALPLADFFSGALSAFCTPRCNPAFARYFFECGFEASGELFIQYCSTNANNERCYNLLNTLATDAVRVQSSCPTGGSSCTSSCQSSIATYRNNSGCCVSVFNISGISNPEAANNNYSLWASCSVETPGLCQSTVSHPGSVTTSSPTSDTTNTQYPLSKLFTGILLGVVMVLTL